MRGRVAARLVASAALLVILASCQPRPQGTVALSLYHRDLSGDPHSYQVLGTAPGSEDWIGLVPDVVSSAGCGFVTADWQLIVVDGVEPPDPAGDIAARAAAIDFEARDPIAIAVSIEPDGSIDITEGVPAWWDADIQRCP
jgi:hypothetical protein